VGMMGAGKSTVGPRLAARLGRAFIDTDHEIERRAGRKIPDIFEAEGEAHFRALEVEAIEIASSNAQPGMAERLSKQGLVVWLKADASVLLERIGSGASRPLLAGLDRNAQLDKLQALSEERRPAYEQAEIVADASRAADAIVDEIVAALHAR
jgi:shikimate kinase